MGLFKIIRGFLRGTLQKTASVNRKWSWCYRGTEQHVSTTVRPNGTTQLTNCDTILEMLHFIRFHHLWQRDPIRLVWWIQSHLFPSPSAPPLIFVFVQLTVILAIHSSHVTENCPLSTALWSERMKQHDKYFTNLYQSMDKYDWTSHVWCKLCKSWLIN